MPRSRAFFRQPGAGATNSERRRVSWSRISSITIGPFFNFLHPRIYAVAVSLVVWFALSAWILFDHRFGKSDQMSLTLAMVSVLLLMAVLLPLGAISRLEEAPDAFRAAGAQHPVSRLARR